MKERRVKTIKKISRKLIPVSSLKGKVIESKKKKLLKKAARKELKEALEDTE